MNQTDEPRSTSDIAAGTPPEGAGGPNTGDRSADASSQPLLPEHDGAAFRERWEQIQVSFVDEPQASVREADTLVAEVMQRLASTFVEERKRLDGEWERGEEVSTEDLRQALQHYRSFFQRLLSA
jgi:hypothetical protein